MSLSPPLGIFGGGSSGTPFNGITHGFTGTSTGTSFQLNATFQQWGQVSKVVGADLAGGTPITNLIYVKAQLTNTGAAVQTVFFQIVDSNAGANLETVHFHQDPRLADALGTGPCFTFIMQSTTRTGQWVVSVSTPAGAVNVFTDLLEFRVYGVEPT